MFTPPSPEETAYWDGVLATYEEKSYSPNLAFCLKLRDTDAATNAVAYINEDSFDPNDPEIDFRQAARQTPKGMGLFWRVRGLLHDMRNRKKRQPVRFACIGCGRNGWGTARKMYCSDKCATKFRVRRFRLGQTGNG